jgi:predicted phosphoadenosine phosphosulfate sulfurtransferase
MQQNLSIISACMRVPAAVSKLDAALMKAIRDLSHAFIIARASQREGWICFVVPFKIYSGDYQHYIEPWAKDVEVTWINDGVSDYPHYRRPLTEEENLFVYSRWMSKYSFDNLEIAFAGWSSAICNRYAAEVAELLSPASNALLARVLAGMNNSTSGGAKP